MTSVPASCTSQSNSTPVASRTRRVASVSSGPVPSPGMRTTRWATGPESTYAPVRVAAVSELADAAAQADAFAQDGLERELAELRAQWADDLEAAARSGDFRERAVAFRAIGQFRWRAKEELLRRGLDDESPAARGSALLSLELLSRDHPSTVNGVRPLLHNLASADGNAAVRRLAIVCLKNGSPERETIVLLEGLAADDEAAAELRRAAAGVAQQLKRRAPKQTKH